VSPAVSSLLVTGLSTFMIQHPIPYSSGLAKVKTVGDALSKEHIGGPP
jgi:hypothetical protein